MEVYLVYEFIYHNFDEDIEEAIEFFGLYQDQKEAIKIANKRVKKGIEECDVVLGEGISNRENPFNETDSVYMYRKNSDMESPIYSIHIKKFKIERKDENE